MAPIYLGPEVVVPHLAGAGGSGPICGRDSSTLLAEVGGSSTHLAGAKCDSTYLPGLDVVVPI